MIDLKLFNSLGSHQMAIDVGTANTVVYIPGEGVVLNEPSVVALETVNGLQRLRAVGSDAKMLMGKTADNIRTYQPLIDGVISDLDLTEQMIKHFIAKATGGPSLISRGPEVVIGVPSASTEVERRAIQAAAINAGARDVWLIEEPLAAAIGAGLPVEEPVGSMVVDIGGGTTEVGIIALKRPTYSTSERVGGDKMDDAIASYVRMKHNVEIGPVSAERIKKEIGSAISTPEGMKIIGNVGGRDVTVGNLCEIALTQAEVADALHDVVQQIVETVSRALGHAGPEIASDIINRGLVMTGGGSLLRNIDTVLAEETGLPVTVAKEPLTCVVLGAARALEDLEYRAEFHVA
ncbi:MAG TPA: rod shape-determining protein [Sphingomicrobium sp.]|nr:rod shape-determining protein [Sphingomicrobium sp.]